MVRDNRLYIHCVIVHRFSCLGSISRFYSWLQENPLFDEIMQELARESPEREPREHIPVEGLYLLTPAMNHGVDIHYLTGFVFCRSALPMLHTFNHYTITPLYDYTAIYIFFFLNRLMIPPSSRASSCLPLRVWLTVKVLSLVTFFTFTLSPSVSCFLRFSIFRISP
jgi:hypothetical protein